MKSKPVPPSSKRTAIDSVTKIVKRVCGLSQSEAFHIAKQAVVSSVPRRSAGGASK